MKAFMHDSNSFSDEKVFTLYLNHGYKGVGMFYVVLEKLAYQEKPLAESVLKTQMMLTKKDDKVFDFMVEIGLLFRKNGEVFNKKLMEYCENYVQRRNKNTELKKQSRDNQAVMENVIDESSMSHHSKERKKEIKKEKKEDDRFDEFWDLYGKKIGKPKTLVEWNRLSKTDIDSIFKALPLYTKEREARFRKDPERFLKHRVWEDEIVVEETKQPVRLSNTRKINEIQVPEDF